MKKLILIIAALIVVGGVAGVTAMVVGRKPAAAHSEKAARHVKVEPTETSTVELDEFLVNLSDTPEQHYLKATVALEVAKSPETEEGMKTATPRIRDAIISTMTRRHFRELLTPSGKEGLKSSIRASVNRVLGDDVVTEVYFTSFAMQ